MPTQSFYNTDDFGGETGITKIWVQEIDATGTNYGSVTQDIDELKDSLISLMVGEVRHAAFTKKFPESADPVADTNAQRETKWLIVMRDTTQYLDGANAVPNPGYLREFKFEVPCADLSLLLAGDEDGNIDTTDPTVIAAIASFEANARSPWNNNGGAGYTPTQVFVSARHVGRNT